MVGADEILIVGIFLVFWYLVVLAPKAFSGKLFFACFLFKTAFAVVLQTNSVQGGLSSSSVRSDFCPRGRNHPGVGVLLSTSAVSTFSESIVKVLFLAPQFCFYLRLLFSLNIKTII